MSRGIESLRGRGGIRLAQAAVPITIAALALVYIRFGDDHADIGGYHNDALAFFTPAAGAARHLPPEYPPLALLPFSVTLLPGPDYGVVFVAAMALLFCAGAIVVARLTSRRVAAAYAFYLLLAGPWIVLGRFDLVPSLAVFVAVVAAVRGRWWTAYALLAAGVLLKLYPLFLLPLFLIEQWRQARPRDLNAIARAAIAPGVFGALVLAVAGAAALADPGGWLGPIRYALSRPVQVESLPSTVLWLLSGFRAPSGVVHSFSSVNVVAAGAGIVETTAFVVLVAGIVAVSARLAAGALSLPRACLACLLLVVLTSRVLSPQYLVWLLPLVALELGVEPLWIGICIITLLAYPVLYELTGISDGQDATTFAPVFLATVAIRNALLVLAGWQVVRRPARVPAAASMSLS